MPTYKSRRSGIDLRDVVPPVFPARAPLERVLVCGGRTFHDREIVFSELDKHSADWGPFKVLIQGGAGGADRLAKAWADERGIECLTFPADWTKHGLPAGPIRNQQMIDEGKPDLVIAFPGGAGTHDMMSKSTKAKLQSIWIIVDKPRS